MSGMPDIGT